MIYERLGPEHVGVEKSELQHTVVKVMMERAAKDSHRVERKDAHTIALAIEGGGLAGAVSAGMCVTLESAGLIDTVDRIYGTSSGALNGSFTASNQAALGSTNYEDVIHPEFYSRKRVPLVLRGQSVIKFDYLFDEIIRNRKPYDFDAYKDGPDFRSISVNLESMEAEVLKDFVDEKDLLQAVRASCAMPILAGPPVKYRGALMTDGGLLHSVPYRAALNDGATHVMALRSRGENHRKSDYSRLVLSVARRVGGPAMASLIERRPQLYNEDADELQYGDLSQVVQVAPINVETPVSQLERSVRKLRNGFKLGVEAMGHVFGMPELDVNWHTEPEVVILKQG